MFESLTSCSAFRCSVLLNMTVIRGSSRLPNALPGIERRYFELVLRVVVVTRSSPVSFGLPMASTSLPV